MQLHLLSWIVSSEIADIIYVGRLTPDKGVDVLLQAMKRLTVQSKLTVVGKGESQESLEQLAAELGLTERVSFVGAKRGAELNELLNRHRVIVIPSRWNEPFGIVALEGIAAGCIAVGSSGGGLPDAIGPCGLMFANEDIYALAEALQTALTDRELEEKVRLNRMKHLEKFHPGTVAKRYLDAFQRALSLITLAHSLRNTV